VSKKASVLGDRSNYTDSLWELSWHSVQWSDGYSGCYTSVSHLKLKVAMCVTWKCMLERTSWS